MSFEDPSRALASAFFGLAVLITVVGSSLQTVTPSPISPSIRPAAMAATPPEPLASMVAAEVSAEVISSPANLTVHIPLKSPLTTTAAFGGTKYDWMRAAGISESEWTYVDFIITSESGWIPTAVNASSGACGLGQQLPCGKWPHQWNDPVGSLIDASSYAKSRYGGWYNAWIWWQHHHWW